MSVSTISGNPLRQALEEPMLGSSWLEKRYLVCIWNRVESESGGVTEEVVHTGVAEESPVTSAEK